MVAVGVFGDVFGHAVAPAEDDDCCWVGGWWWVGGCAGIAEVDAI